jgi:serine/threonine protein kinase
MAYYEGETLKTKVEQGPMKTEEAIDIAIQVTRGLTKAHEQGIVHRDIKPANIMVTTDGVAKIVDFGLAKLSGGTMLTKTGSTLGTAAYMSPEQARGDAVDHRTDIWSLGVVLYEMIAGHRPFRSD